MREKANHLQFDKAKSKFSRNLRRENAIYDRKLDTESATDISKIPDLASNIYDIKFVYEILTTHN